MWKALLPKIAKRMKTNVRGFSPKGECILQKEKTRIEKVAASIKKAPERF